MAHRLLRLDRVRETTKPKVVGQQFKHLLILDFEATCERHKKINPQEIIELPCLALSTKTWEVKDVFHEYVKPRIKPELTSYCTDLTGIIQEMIEDREHFPKIFQDFQNWLEEGDYFKKSGDSAFVTCGDWDLRVMLPEQCALSGISLPNHFRKWINLKKAFWEATGYYPKSLKDMLKHLDLPMCGQLHSGIQDVHNMTRIIQLLGSRDKANFNITSTLES